MFDRKRRNVILGGALLGAGLILCSATSVQAATGSEVIASAGVGSVLDVIQTEEQLILLAEKAQGAFYGYTNIGIAHTESGYLNVREEASTSGKLVGKMASNSACEVLDTVDGWAHITSGEVEGYVSLDYLTVGAEARMLAKDLVETVAVSNVDGLNVREEPSTDASILTQIAKGEEMEYVDTLESGWIQLSIDGEDAYVSADYVTVEEKLNTAITMSELLYGQGVSDVRVSLVEYAKQFLGNPYVWGGTSLTKGCDCSGFVLSVYKHFGVTLSHHSGSQAKEGTKISYGDLQPGDLIFYGNSRGTINHVAIYIGGGQIIHASSPKTGIKISKYNYRTPLKYVRILSD